MNDPFKTIGGADADVVRAIAPRKAARSRESSAAELARRQIDFMQRQAELHEDQLALQQVQRELLQEHARLLERQADGARPDNFHRRLRIGRDVCLLLLGVVVLALLGRSVFDAWNANSVVIRAFDVPPALDAKGYSGEVIASMLLDRLRDLQGATHAAAAKRQVVDAWSGEIRVEGREADFLLARTQRFLRGWLGRETRFGGSVVESAGDTITLTVRGEGLPAKTFAGPPQMLGALTNDAAEYIFGRSEPYLFASYLAAQSRKEDAIALLRDAYAKAPASDQPLLMNQWGLLLTDIGRNDEAIEKFRETVKLKPEMWLSWNNIISTQLAMQQEEAALQTGAAMDRAAKRGAWGARDVPPILFFSQDQLRWDLPANLRELEADRAASGGHGTGLTEAAPQQAQILALMHDPRASEALLRSTPGIGKDPYVIAASAFARGLTALDFGDNATALVRLREVDAAAQSSPSLLSNFTTSPACWVALAEEFAGDPANADAAIARGGQLVDCLRFRADITDHRGDWTRAQLHYADAVALAPSSPSAYYSWGMALSRHGDAAAAIVKFKDANARGPHWADPIAAWGDALATRKDFAAAVAQYQRAEEYAPNWGALHVRWGRALQLAGRQDEAIAQYRKARELELSETDRKSLEGCCGR